MTKDKLILENVKIFDKWLDNFIINYDTDENKQILKLDNNKYEKEIKTLTTKEVLNPSYNHVYII